jgi:hypothetical protein
MCTQVPPQWCAADKACFRMIVDYWVSPEYVAKHKEAQQKRRLLGGGVPRQGNLTLAHTVLKRVSKCISYFFSHCYSLWVSVALLFLMLSLVERRYGQGSQ